MSAETALQVELQLLQEQHKVGIVQAVSGEEHGPRHEDGGEEQAQRSVVES